MPFPWYNTSPPNNGASNTINSVSQNIRDFLLLKNLPPQYPFLTTNPVGGPRIGEPVLDTSINNNSNVIPDGLPLEIVGLDRYDIAVAPNKFKNHDADNRVLQNIDNITQTANQFGVDYPQDIEYPRTATNDVDRYGLLAKSQSAGFLSNLVSKNIYSDELQQSDIAPLSSDPLPGFGQNYEDVWGFSNPTGLVQAADILGSILNGQGVGFDSSGIVTNFDLRASLLGRIMGATGLVKDTPLGQQGAKSLAIAIGNNAAFGAQSEALGTLNIQDNILSLVRGGGLVGLRPDYTITTAGGIGGEVLSYAQRILGVSLPTSFLQKSGSLFTYESGNVDNVTRANNMLYNTGLGQVAALTRGADANINGIGDYDKPQKSPFRTGYAAGYLNPFNGKLLITPNIYAYYQNDGQLNNFLNAVGDDVIADISVTQDLESYGFKSPKEIGFGAESDDKLGSGFENTWTSSNGNAVNKTNQVGSIQVELETEGVGSTSTTNKKSLLYKTQQLFNDKKMLTIVSTRGDLKNQKTDTEVITTNGGGLSKGSAVLSSSSYEGGITKTNTGSDASNVYCRTYTALHKYAYVNQLGRSNKNGTSTSDGSLKADADKLKQVSNGYRFQYDNSTLEEGGFVKIAPYTDENSNWSQDNDIIAKSPKNYMFSIENLAWSGMECELPPVEVGSGDLLSGVRGRIMWFPPYDIQVSESVSVDWENTKFIGRGEPLYTYNNTERTGQLSFKIITDHSSYTNAFRDIGGQAPDDNYVASFMAGCVDMDSQFGKYLTVSQTSTVTQQITTKTQIVVDPDDEVAPEGFEIYFPNDVYDPFSPTNYEQIAGQGSGNIQGQVTPSSGGLPSSYGDNQSFGLNAEFSGGSSTYWDNLSTELDKCPNCIITVQGFASGQGTPASNDILNMKRGGNVKSYLQQKIGTTFPITVAKGVTITNAGCDSDLIPRDSEICKKQRYVSVNFEVSPEGKAATQPKKVEQENTGNQTISSVITNKMFNEATYFDRIKQNDPFIYNSFRRRIKYFHPAFHSMTPEGLNTRLTFLHQCTRQGNTIESMGGNNLAFGTPPICILRLGDFFHTKIVINSMSIDYEPLVWDLNPEGVGVQPMIANVNLSYAIIGGESLRSPINKLQNALSFNFYANTHVYDPRASYVDKQGDNYKLVEPNIDVFANGGYTGNSTIVETPNVTIDQLAQANNK